MSMSSFLHGSRLNQYASFASGTKDHRITTHASCSKCLQIIKQMRMLSEDFWRDFKSLHIFPLSLKHVTEMMIRRRGQEVHSVMGSDWNVVLNSIDASCCM